VIFENGTVRTLDPSLPTAGALAIAGDRIAGGVGTHETALASPDVIDLGGRCVLPGFTDSHVHFPTWAMAQHEVRLEGAQSLEEAVARVRDSLGTGTGWLLGRASGVRWWGSLACALPWVREVELNPVQVTATGVGSHIGTNDDPAGEILPAIEATRARARDAGRSLAVVASVTGTDQDPQRRATQATALAAGGVVVMDSNAQAARLAARIAAARSPA
jgi:predicted amidohydrolase YtcJ